MVHDIVGNQTIYKGVNSLEPSHFMTFTNNVLTTKKYYEFRIYDRKVRSSEEHAEGLKHVLYESVKEKIHVPGKVGLLLSGGLDSSSVGAIAAKELGLEGKMLNTYSYRPSKKYNIRNPNGYKYDETDDIEEVLSMHSNIKHKYYDNSEVNSLTNLEELLFYLEHPFKYVENSFWLNGIYKTALDDDCSILLTGTYGNFTISFGSFLSHMITLIEKRKYVKLYNEIRLVSNATNIKQRRIIKIILRNTLPKTVFKKMKLREERNQFSPLNASLMNNKSISVIIRKAELGEYSKGWRSVYESRKLSVSPSVLAQCNGTMAKQAFNQKLQYRDPTASVKVIEYCYSVPYDEYYSKNEHRLLIRNAMKDIIPESIRTNYKTRGLQGGDWYHRFYSSFHELKTEMRELLEIDLVAHYLDSEKIIRFLNELTIPLEKESIEKFKVVIISIVFGRFIKYYENI